jgi:hypothetical protein
MGIEFARSKQGTAAYNRRGPSKAPFLGNFSLEGQ